MNKKFIISLILISLFLSVEAAKVQQEKPKNFEAEETQKKENEQEQTKNAKSKEGKVKKEKAEQAKQEENNSEKPVKEAKQEKPAKEEKVKAPKQSKHEPKQEEVQETKKEKATKEEKASKQEKPAKEEKIVKEEKTVKESVKEEKTKAPKEENVKASKEKNPVKEEQVKAPKEKVKVSKETPEQATQEEKVKAPKEEKVKAPKEEKVKAPKEEKVKAPKEEKVKVPKAPKEEVVKAPKVEVPRNFTQEVIAKVAKHAFWNGTQSVNYLQSYKLAGLKKTNCLVNELKKLQSAQVAAKNLCLINQYNAALDNEWQIWNTNSTTESGKYRFFNNGTSCEQEFNWLLSEQNNTATENGSFVFSNSTNGIKFTCKVSGSQNTNQTSKWQSSTSYTMSLTGDKRGEIYDKQSSSETVFNQNKTESTSYSEYVEDSIFLTLNGQPQTNQTFQSRSSMGDNKINRGHQVQTVTINGNTSVTESKWNKSKTILEFVETYAEGQRFGSEHSKVKSETSSQSTSGVVVIDSGITSERSRNYYKQTFGPNANNIDYNDIGQDRKWKNNSLRPEKNIDIPANWNVNGTYAVPTQQPKQEATIQQKKIDL